MPGPSWEKVPPALADAFAAEVALRPELAARKMFGYPAAFLGGHLTTALNGPRWIVRLPEPERGALQAQGGSPFEPMPGRPMREYVVLPDALVADPGARAQWIDRAVAYVQGLPPKA